MTKIDPTPRVSCKYGAPMGRPSTLDGDVIPGDAPLYFRHIRLDSGGYDAGGAYWGIDLPLYWYGNDAGDIWAFIRARDRNDAKAEVRKAYPGARFFV